jgi:hypothetical protein
MFEVPEKTPNIQGITHKTFFSNVKSSGMFHQKLQYERHPVPQYQPTYSGQTCQQADNCADLPVKNRSQCSRKYRPITQEGIPTAGQQQTENIEGKAKEKKQHAAKGQNIQQLCQFQPDIHLVLHALKI